MLRARESAGMEWLGSLGLTTPGYTRLAKVDELAGNVELAKIGPPWVVKPDISLGGKGSLGLVHVVNHPADLSAAVENLLNRTVLGSPIDAVIIEEAIPGEEFYLSVCFDGARRAPVIRLALQGGVGFDPAAAASVYVGSFMVPDADQSIRCFVEDVCGAHHPALAAALGDLTNRLWAAFFASEAVLLELNPIRWDGRSLTPVGLALEFDDAGSPRSQPMRPVGLQSGPRPVSTAEQRISELDKRLGGPAMKFIELDGDVALLVVGGGASLLSFDQLSGAGVRPACYADYSPGAGLEKLVALLRAGLALPNLRGAIIGAAILSLMDCRTFAQGIARAIEESRLDTTAVPTVVRLAGTDELAARDILAPIPGLTLLGRESTLEDACQALVERIS